MRREILFAILAGTLFGVIIAFGIWRLNSSLTPPENTSTSAPATPTPDFGITISKPDQNEVITKSPSIVEGVTQPNSWVVVSTEDEDYFDQADASGAFLVEVELVGGINQILIVSFDENGNSTDTKLTVVYSTQFDKVVEEEETE